MFVGQFNLSFNLPFNLYSNLNLNLPFNPYSTCLQPQSSGYGMKTKFVKSLSTTNRQQNSSGSL